MSTLKDTLYTDTNYFFQGDYELADARIVPTVEKIPFGRIGKELELAMLFVDIRSSTKIASIVTRKSTARMYQSFLTGVAKIVKQFNGEIRSFNGDGLLVVFDGNYKCSSAVASAFRIAWFCRTILSPKMQSLFRNIPSLANFKFEFGIGIDVGDILVVKAGIRGDDNNDLVWSGLATNIAVKLSDESKDSYSIHISEGVYKHMDNKYKFINTDVWEKILWINNMKSIYRSRKHTEP